MAQTLATSALAYASVLNTGVDRVCWDTEDRGQQNRLAGWERGAAADTGCTRRFLIFLV